jgi:hypothetical protein
VKKIRWLPDVAPHDYQAAQNYLSLRLDPARAELAVQHLSSAGVTRRRANDIIRACGLDVLPLTDAGVAKNLRKVRSGIALSPVLVVSYEVGGDIADGYHRVCMAYHRDPWSMVPLRLAHVPLLEHSRR